MKKIPIVILASGRGSVFESISRSVQSGDLAAEILAVISDRPGAPVLGKAAAVGLKAITVQSSGDRHGHEKEVLNELVRLSPRFVVMAGYMRMVTPDFIEAFRSDSGYSRIVNVHPSLLPAFPGLNSYAQAFHYGVKITGVTVHLVDEKMDSGPICAQEAFSIEDCRSEGEVEARGLAIEHRLYPETLKWVLPEEFKVVKSSGGPHHRDWAKFANSGRIHVRPN